MTSTSSSFVRKIENVAHALGERGVAGARCTMYSIERVRPSAGRQGQVRSVKLQGIDAGATIRKGEIERRDLERIVVRAAM
jgi:hypothetical protein